MEDLETPRSEMPSLGVMTPGQSVQRQELWSLGNDYFTGHPAGQS